MADPARLRALLEAVRAVRDSVTRLEQEIMAALAEDQIRTPLPDQLRESLQESFTLAELGEWLRVGRTTAYKLVSENEIPSYRVGRAIPVRRQDVERWLERKREGRGGPISLTTALSEIT